MAEKKEQTKLEREYVIPLRAEWRKVANYRRTGRAIKAIKKFIARHMKVPERDLTKVKLDQYLNQEIWFRGRKKPPAKIKVKAIKEGDIVKVELLEMPEALKFAKAKHEKRHKPAEKAKAPAPEKPKEEKTEQEKETEKEKAQSAADTKALEAKTQAKAQAQSKLKETPIHRKALKK